MTVKQPNLFKVNNKREGGRVFSGCLFLLLLLFALVIPAFMAGPSLAAVSAKSSLTAEDRALQDTESIIDEFTAEQQAQEEADLATQAEVESATADQESTAQETSASEAPTTESSTAAAETSVASSTEASSAAQQKTSDAASKTTESKTTESKTAASKTNDKKTADTKTPAKAAVAKKPAKASEGTTERDVPVYLNGDYVEYKSETQKIIAKGNATVEHKKMRLAANVIQADLREEKIIAYGNVIYSQDEGGRQSDVEGQFLIYYMKTGEGRLTEGYAETHKETGNEYYSLGEIVYHIDESYAKELILTSCDEFRDAHSEKIRNSGSSAGKLFYDRPAPEALRAEKKGGHRSPHWKAHARSVKIYPKDHMVLQNVNYYIAGKRIWHSGAMVVPLKRKPSKPFKPGYSKTKGFYFTAGFDKYWDKNNYAKMNVDFSAKQGTSYSINHYYSHNKSDTTTTFDYRSVSRTDPVTQDVIANYSESINFNLVERYTFDQKTSANMNLRYTSNRSKSLTDLSTFLPANQEMNLNLDVTQRNKDYDLSLKVRQRMDPDGKDYEADDQIQVLDMEPELTLKTRSKDLGKSGLGYYSEFVVGKYFERAYHTDRDTGLSQLSELTTVKKDGQFNVYSKPLTFLDFMTASFKSRYRRTMYTTGDDKEVVDHNVQLKQQYTRDFYSNFSYNHRRASGWSPLSADAREDDLNNIRGDVVLQLLDDKLRLNLLTANYDYMTNIFYGVNTSINYRSATGALNAWSLNLTGNYDLKSTRLSEWGLSDMELSNLSARYNIERTNRWKFSTSMYYDNNLRKFQNISSTWDFPVSQYLKLSVDSRYDFNRKEFTQLNYAAIVNLHCWEAKMDWSKQTEDFNFSIYLKVYPEKAIKANYDGATKSFKPSYGSSLSQDEFSIGDFF